MKERFQRFAGALLFAAYSGGIIFSSEFPYELNQSRLSRDWYAERAVSDNNEVALPITEKDEMDLLLKDIQNKAVRKGALYRELTEASGKFFFTGADGSKTQIVSGEELEEAKRQWEEKAQSIIKKYIPPDTDREQSLALIESEISISLMNRLLYDHDSLKKMSDREAAGAIVRNLSDKVDSETKDSMMQVFNDFKKDLELVDKDNLAAIKDVYLTKFRNQLEMGISKWNQAEEDFLKARCEWEREAETSFSSDNKIWADAYRELMSRKEEWNIKFERQIQEGQKEWSEKYSVLKDEIQKYLTEYLVKVRVEQKQKDDIYTGECQMYDMCRQILCTAQSGIDSWYVRWSEKYRGLYSYWKTESNFGSKTDLNFTTSESLKNEIYQWKKDYVKIGKEIFSTYHTYISQETARYEYLLSNPHYPYKEEEKELLQYYRAKMSELFSVNKIFSKINEDSTAEEIKEVNKIICSIKDSCADINSLRKKMSDDFWICFNETAEFWSAEQELLDWLALYDNAKRNAASTLEKIYSINGIGLENEDASVLENESAKLSALKKYWESRECILQNVLNYSANNSSSLENAQTTQTNLEKQTAAYDEAKKAYQEEISRLEEEKKKVTLAQENYSSSLYEVQKASESIDEKRKEYDSLYEKWYVLDSDSAFENILSLKDQLDRLEMNDTDFSALLYEYCNSEQQKENYTLSQRIEQIRNNFENGVSLSVSEAAEKDAVIFATGRIEEIKKKIEIIIKGENIDIEELTRMQDELMVLHSEAADALPELIKSGSEDAIRNQLSLIIEYCRQELKNREAFYILMENDIELIEEFFKDNPGSCDILDKFSDISFALLNRKNNEARKAVCTVIQNSDRNNLSEYFLLLDNAAVDLNDAEKGVLALYKISVQKEREDTHKASLLMKNIIENLNKELVLTDKNYHLTVFEEFFGSSNSEFESYHFEDENSESGIYLPKIEDSLQLREQCLSLLETAYHEALQPAKTMELLNKQMAILAEEIQKAQEVYEKKVEICREKDSHCVLSLYEQACENYNTQIEKVHSFYETLEDKRRELRVAQEIYFYAQNEYLHGNIDFSTQLQNARLQLSNVEKAIRIFEAVSHCEKNDSEYKILMSEFEISTTEYYKMQVLAYEYEMEIAAQKNVLCKAQAEEHAALNRLVCEYKDNMAGSNFNIPSGIKDFISAAKNPDGTYSFELNSFEEATDRRLNAGENLQNEEVLKEYYTELGIKDTDVFGNEILSSPAKKDAMKFLVSIQEKNYSLEELALATLWYKIDGDQNNINDSWFKVDENPWSEKNYPIGDIPEEMHSVSIWAAFTEGRITCIKNAYDKVMESPGGMSDIAKYILYSETNISGSLNLYEREKNEISIGGYNFVIDKIASRVKNLKKEADIQLAVVSVFSMIAALPFGIGAWALVPEAAAMTVYLTLVAMVNKLTQVKKDVGDICSGYRENSAVFQKTQDNYYDFWIKAVERRQEEERKLNLLCRGNEHSNGQKITWTDFYNALNVFLDSGNTNLKYSDIKDIRDIGRGADGLKAIFYQVTEEKDFINVSDVIQTMNITLKTSQENQFGKLTDYVGRKDCEREEGEETFYQEIKNAQNSNREIDENVLTESSRLAWKNGCDYYTMRKDLLSYYKNLLQVIHVRAGRETETYIIDIFEKIQEALSGVLEGENYRRLQSQEFYLNMIEEDFVEQKEIWQEKIDIVKNEAAAEWNKADKNISCVYEKWKNDWNKNYSDKNADWEKNYSDYLNDKQEWINTQYDNGKREHLSVDDYINSLYDSNKFEKIFDAIGSLNSFAKNEDFYIDGGFANKIESSLLVRYDSILDKQNKLEEQMKYSAAKLKVQELREQLDNNIADCYEMLENKNKSIENWEFNLVRQYGYAVDYEIHRNAIVDSTAFSTIRERQTVHKYEYFKSKSPEIDSALSEAENSDYSGNSDYLLINKIKELARKIQDWSDKIFGKQDANGKSVQKGLFEEHVGKAPTFVKNIDTEKSREENLLEKGSGEMGKIMLDFQWNSIKNSEGYAELSKAFYDQKLFSSDLGWLKIPTFRDVAALVCDIIGNCGFVWVKYLDDALFATLDLSLQYKTGDQVFNDLGHTALGAAASKGISYAGSKILKNAKYLQQAGVSYADSVATSYINAFDFSRGTLDWREAQKAWTSTDSLTKAGGALVSGGISSGIGYDSAGTLINERFFGDMKKIGATAGSLTASALKYLATGDISFNLLNIKGNGLFNIAIEDGKFSANLTGAEFSISDIAYSLMNAKNAAKIVSLKNNGREGAAALSAVNELSYSTREENLKLAERLFNGENEIIFEDDSSKFADSPYGYVDSVGNFVLDASLLEKGKEGQSAITSYLAIQNARKKESLVEKESSDRQKSDATIGSLCDTAEAYLLTKILLDLKDDSSGQNKLLEKIAAAYKENNIAGIYSIYAAAYEAEKNTGAGKNVISFDNILEPGWVQNEDNNRGILLGQSLSMEEYNSLARQNAVERYVQKQKEELIKKHGCDEVPMDILEVELTAARQYAETRIQNGVTNEEFGYYPETYNTDLKNYGCTLSTVSYISYAITGQVTSLQEANEILKEKGLFVKGEKDKNGVAQVNEIGCGKGYVDAVNAIAGGEYLQMDGNYLQFSEKETNKIFNRLVKSYNDSKNVYFVHMRVLDNSHSVLFKSMEYGENTRPEDARINVLNPWRDSERTSMKVETLGQVDRADFYKLTESGKEMYNSRN